MKNQKTGNKTRQKSLDKPLNTNFIAYFFLACAMLLVLIVRIRLISFPFERDEGEYACFARLILEGIPPYQAVYNMKLPGTYYTYALFMLFFGQSVEAIRTGVLLLSLGSVWFVFAIARRLFNSFTGGIAALTTAILSLSWAFMGSQAHATHFVTFWALAGFLLLLIAYDKNKTYLYLVSGVCFGLSFLMKQSGVFFSVFGFILVALHWYYRSPRKPGGLLGALSLYTAGVLIPLILTALVMILSGVWDQFRFWTLEYPADYGSRIPPDQILPTFGYNFKVVFGFVGLLWILGGLGLIALFFYRMSMLTKMTVLLFVIFAIANAIPGFYFRQHYFIPVIPALALLVAILTDLINQKLSVRFPAISYVTAAVFILLMIPVLNRNKELFFTINPKLLCETYYSGNPFGASPAIGKFIRNNTEKNDRIFIFGSEPQIYVYAQRRPSTGYIYMYDLVYHQPHVKRMQKEMIREVEAHPPKMIVFASSRFSWLAEPGLSDTLFSWFNRYLTDWRYEYIGIADIINPTETNFEWGKECLVYKPVSDNTLRVFRRPD